MQYSFKIYLYIVFNLYCVKYCETAGFKFTAILFYLVMFYGLINISITTIIEHLYLRIGLLVDLLDNVNKIRTPRV